MAALFGLALWLAGIGHFVLLGASFQVPARLGWKEDLAQLRPFNRKLMWTYGAFTVLTIVAFGSLTLVLHDDFSRRDRFGRLHRDLLDVADHRRCRLFQARRLAVWQIVRHRACDADGVVYRP